MSLESIVDGLSQAEDWKMNLFVVSEKHRVVIFAIQSKLHIYELDPLSLEVRGLLNVIGL